MLKKIDWLLVACYGALIAIGITAAATLLGPENIRQLYELLCLTLAGKLY